MRSIASHNATLWLYQYNNVSPYYETEVGIWNGANVAGQTTTVPRFYFEDYNATYGNSWHGDFSDSVGLGSHYYAYIRYRSGNWWDVYINGWTYGSGSYHQYSTAAFQAVGEEWTYGQSANDAISGAAQNVSYWDSGGSQHTNWANAQNKQTNPGNGFWYMPYNYYSWNLNQGWSC